MAEKINRFAGYLFTLKAEEWDGYEAFFDNWTADHRTTEEWSSGPSKSIPKDAPIFVMKQGKAPRGVIAAGFTASGNHRMRRWSKRKNKLVPGRANDLRFTHFLDPERDQLLDISDLPKQYGSSRNSGVGLPPEVFREIKKRWIALLGGNANEAKQAKNLATLDGGDADGDYRITNRDTRATAIKQIKERRGQGKFRQKMIGIYRGACAISGCRVMDVLEAAHIMPYLGDNDQNPENGILLRADLHTLFDLLLLGINPITKVVHLHPVLHDSEYKELHGKKLRRAKTLPNPEALRRRWREFKENQAGY